MRSSPHSTKYPLENTYGMMVYSGLPLAWAEVKFLLDKEIPSIHSHIQLRSGDLVEVIAVHPRPPLPRVDTAERDAELVLVGRQAKVSRYATVVAGDFNDVCWSQTTRLFQQVSGLLTPAEGAGSMRPIMPTIRCCGIRLTTSFIPQHFGCAACRCSTISGQIISPSSLS